MVERKIQVAFGAFPLKGDDALAAGRPLLGVPGLGRASFDAAGNPQSARDQMPENRAQ